MVYSVCVQLPDGTKVQGRNRPSLKAAESLAMQRAAELPSNAAALIIGHTFELVATYPGQLIVSAPKLKRGKLKPASRAPQGRQPRQRNAGNGAKKMRPSRRQV
jgi:hypothetical protein